MTTELVPIAQLQVMASAFARSGLFGIKTPDQALALMLIAQSEGLHPATAARDYDIIQGRPAKKAEAMLRSFGGDGGKVTWHSLTDTLADATFSHPSGGEVRISWDMARAAQAGLASKDMWKKYPRQMLRSRVVSEGVRTVCPMATGGLYVPEEIDDMKPAPKEVESQVVTHEQPKPVIKPVSPDNSGALTVQDKQIPVPEQKTPWTGIMSLEQIGRLFAIASARNWSKDQIKSYLKARWGLDSTKELKKDEYEALVQIIETLSYEGAKGDLDDYQASFTGFLS